LLVLHASTLATPAAHPTGFPPKAIRLNIQSLTSYPPVGFPQWELFLCEGVRHTGLSAEGVFRVKIRSCCPAFALPAPLCAGFDRQPEVGRRLCDRRSRGLVGGARKLPRRPRAAGGPIPRLHEGLGLARREKPSRSGRLA